MCGRYTLFANYQDIIERFAIEAAINEEFYIPSYNIAPSNSVLSIVNDGRVNRLGFLKWGLIPPWAKDEKSGYKLINARAETLMVKPSFREAYKKRRCLVIADSYYEWKRQDDNSKTPMRIKLKTNELFGMAGLWERWQTLNGNTIYSCSIITTQANELTKNIHERMPAILKPEDEKVWLDPAITETNQLNGLLKPLSDSLMEVYEVSNLVNSPLNNSPNLIKRIL